MRLRRLALAVGLASAFGANMASALGLGEIRLRSSLNQPLLAEIKLLQVRDLSKNEILVNLASKDEFQQVGIDRPFFLTDLKFDVDMDAPSGPVVRVTSSNPVREPYLNFLVESHWPNGRMLREYTVLLDLPVFSDAPVKPIASATIANTTTGTTPRQSTAQPGASSRSVTQSTVPFSGEVYGPVSATDTLWDIALKVRPSRQYTPHKTMLAIQRLNPEAFINGNINLLRRGQVLRVPQASEIDQVSQQQAIEEVAYQNNQWTGEQTRQTTGAQLDATGRTESTATSAGAVEGRLKVAGDSSVSKSQAGAVGGRGSRDGDTDALQDELATSLEELDKVRRENSDLQDRVHKLEDQIKTMERLVEVSSQEMRALQLQSDQDEEAAVVPMTATDGGDTVATPLASSPGATAKPAASKDVSKAVTGAPQKQKGLLDFITDNILYIGGALVAVLAAVLMLLRRREEPAEPELAMATAAPVPVVADTTAAESDTDLDDTELDVEEESLFADEPSADEEQTVAAVESQTDDVVGEADIYIAYGKLDQATEMLLKALEQDQDNSAVRLKLMEVYAEANELEAFDLNYAQIASSGDEVAIARADDLRMHFPDLDLPTQDDDEFSLEPEEASENQPVAEDTSGSGVVPEHESLQAEADNDLDLVLDEDASGSEEDFEFSLDLDGDETPVEDFAAHESDALEREVDSLAGDTSSERLDFDLEFDSDSDTVARQPVAEQSSEEVSVEDFDLDFGLTDASTDELETDLAAEDSGFDLDLEDANEPDLEFTVDADDLQVDDVEVTEDKDTSGFAAADSGDVSRSLDIDDAQLSQLSEAESGFDLDAEELSDLDISQADADDTELDFELPADDDIDLAELDKELGALSDDLEPSDDDVSFDTEDFETALDEDVAGSAAEEPVTDFSSDVAKAFTPGEQAADEEQSSDEELFSAALADLPNPEDVLADETADAETEEEFDFLADADEAATKLDLARAYIDMGDHDGARDILDEVVEEGSDDQRRDAEELMTRLG